MQRFCLTGFILLCLLIAISDSVRAQKDSLVKPVFTRFSVAQHFIQVEDTIRLSALIVRHVGDDHPSPVILMATCYPRDFNDASALKPLIGKGYIGVLVYSRGRERSGGRFHPFENEAKDLYKVIDWISKQSWCNGKVGMFGGSYLGFAQWAACKTMHPALKTIIPQVAAAPGIDFPRQNGIFTPYNLRWLKYTTNSALNDSKTFSDTKLWNSLYNKYYTLGIPFNRIDSLHGQVDSIYQRWLRHPDYDKYWADMIPSTPAEFAAIKIPILSITGYFDDEQPGAFYYYNMHHRYGDKKALSDHYLLIGPWDHFGSQGSPAKKIGSYTVDSAAVINITQIMKEWFDFTLKGLPRPAFLKDKVNYFVMGDSWKHSSSLQLASPDTIQFFLTNGAIFNKLVSYNVQKNAIDLLYNPADTRDSIGMRNNPDAEYFPLHDAYLRNHNQLIFDSRPLAKDMEITGAPVAELFISVDHRDIDIRLDYYEVSEEGESFLLSTIVQRASYHQSNSQRNLLATDSIYRFYLNNGFFTSKLMRKGSFLRLVVRPLNSPFWQKNYGTGKDVSEESIKDASSIHIKFHTGGLHSSRILLPVNLKQNK